MLSYGPLKEDGIVSADLTNAIRQFQADEALSVTGQPDQATADALIAHAGDRTFLVDGCGQRVEPRATRMFLNCSMSMGLVDVQWQDWSAQHSRGTGRVFNSVCDAGCVNGDADYVDVALEAYEPQRFVCADGAPFQLFTLRITATDGEIWGQYTPVDFEC